MEDSIPPDRRELRLRDVVVADVPTLAAHRADAGAARMVGFAVRDEATSRAHWLDLLAKPEIVKRALVVDGVVAGHLLSFELEGERHVGYWLGREFWGRGLATRALALFLEELPTRPLHAIVAKHNPASRRVLEKCGFRVTGETSREVEGLGEVAELTLRLDG